MGGHYSDDVVARRLSSLEAHGLFVSSVAFALLSVSEAGTAARAAGGRRA